uniref:Uncharacterized protein n=1 Tax=Lepeophtheirus salmonis TaxID=72036 RepID=A0A0K2V001_LEPSM
MDISYGSIGYMNLHLYFSLYYSSVHRNIPFTHLLILSSCYGLFISTLMAISLEQVPHLVDLISFNGRIVHCAGASSCQRVCDSDF